MWEAKECVWGSGRKASSSMDFAGIAPPPSTSYCRDPYIKNKKHRKNTVKTCFVATCDQVPCIVGGQFFRFFVEPPGGCASSRLDHGLKVELGSLYKRPKKAIFLSFFHDFFAGLRAVNSNFPSFFAGPGPGPGADRAQARAQGLRRRMDFFLFTGLHADFDYFFAALIAKKNRDQVGR